SGRVRLEAVRPRGAGRARREADRGMSRPTTLTTRLVAASVALALVIALALTALIVALGQLRRAVAREARSTETVTGVLTLRNAVSDLEASLRGYLLTTDPAFRRQWGQ